MNLIRLFMIRIAAGLFKVNVDSHYGNEEGSSVMTRERK
jgi:hypothetical protein